MITLTKPHAKPGLRSYFGRRRVAWLHLYGHCCIGLDRFCPIDRVICTDFGREFELFKARTGIRFLSLEQITGRRQVASDANMRSLIPKLGARIRKELSALDGAWTLVCPYACRGLRQFGERAGWRVASPDVRLAAQLSDKSVLREALKELDLPRIEGRWMRLATARYDELSREFGWRFVLQKRSGSGGSGTAIVSSREDLRQAAKRFGDGPIHVARFIGERSVNINAVATSRGVAVSWPNLQIVGLPELHARPGQYAGNDYSGVAQLPREWIEDVTAQTECLGRWAAARGHRGLFGLDFVFDEAMGRAYVVDFNPRWQGSTALLVHAELRANRTPLAALEMAYRVGAISGRELLRKYGGPQPVEGSQLGLHWRGPRPRRLRSEVAAGVVAMKTGKIGLRRQAWQLSDLSSNDEVLLMGGVPGKGTLIEAGATVLKVWDTEAAVGGLAQQLTPKAREIVRSVYESLGLEKPAVAERVAAKAAGS